MKEEIKLLIFILSKPKEFAQEIPIRYLIPTFYECTVPRDTYLNIGGTFCDKFKFWYYIEQPETIEARTLNRNKKV